MNNPSKTFTVICPEGYKTENVVNAIQALAKILKHDNWEYVLINEPYSVSVDLVITPDLTPAYWMAEEFEVIALPLCSEYTCNFARIIVDALEKDFPQLREYFNTLHEVWLLEAEHTSIITEKALTSLYEDVKVAANENSHVAKTLIARYYDVCVVEEFIKVKGLHRELSLLKKMAIENFIEAKENFKTSKKQAA